MPQFRSESSVAAAALSPRTFGRRPDRATVVCAPTDRYFVVKVRRGGAGTPVGAGLSAANRGRPPRFATETSIDHRDFQPQTAVARDFPSEWQLELDPHLAHHDESILHDESSGQRQGPHSSLYALWSRHVQNRLLDFVATFSMKGLAELPMLNQLFSEGIALSDFTCDFTPCRAGGCETEPSNSEERATYQKKWFSHVGHPFYAGLTLSRRSTNGLGGSFETKIRNMSPRIPCCSFDCLV